MASAQAALRSVGSAKFTLTEERRQSFADNGYLTLEDVVEKSLLAQLHGDILGEFERAKSGGRLFAGGGSVSGHLNCFPGTASRFVYDTLRAQGVIDIVQALSPTALREPNVGCNLNLPGSSAQNDHVDGYASRPFLIVNIAAVDTDLTNGAMDILCRTHRKSYKYWQILLERPERRRLCMSRGDVLIRTSTLWHRGMPNPSRQPRPMLALTWEDAGSAHPDPYRINGGRIEFLPNRYAVDWAGRMRERAFVAAPRVATALRAVRSFL
jgi:Phytanoyl-CoA dioxygenase (PhyH)